MFDAALRRASEPLFTRAATALHRRSVGATALTVIGLVLGLGAAGAAAVGLWWVALGLWLASRLVDGLDGAVARLDGPTARGGFADIVADFTVYAAFVAGVAIQRPEARLAAVVLLCTYYLSGTAFLAWSSLAERSGDGADRGLELGDDRSLRFVGGLAEGFETIVAYAIVCVVPERAATVLWVFAVIVGITAVQRIVFAIGDLGQNPRRP